jgi:aromatic-L-amino-acid/L-tryptophan decarboxylase
MKVIEMHQEKTIGVIDPATFGELATLVISQLQKSFSELDNRPLTCHIPPAEILNRLREQDVPDGPRSPNQVLQEALDLMLNYSLFSAHPRFLGYVCPAVDPMGVLADMIVAAVNPNAASAMMAPIGHVLEHTVIRWLAKLIGFPAEAGGILLSGGNEANLVGLLAAREHRAPWPIREVGFNHPDAAPLYVYTTKEAHNGLQKAMEIAGLGRNALRIVDTDKQLRLDVNALREAIRKDRAAGGIPICVVATVGTIATGVIDPLPEIVEIAADEGLWVHVDGSYGAAAAMLLDAPVELRAISQIDSISWDPHKWLRVPFEAGCVLLRDPGALTRTFGLRPTYYNFGEYSKIVHYYEQGPQNSRHLRALKVWMSLNQHGREGHASLIARDIDLTGEFFRAVQSADQLEAWTCNLCVATFQYVPDALKGHRTEPEVQCRLNKINQLILNRIQEGGDSYLSNAVVDGNFLLRACFVNYRTRYEDIPHVIDLVRSLGREIAEEVLTVG